MRRNISRIAVPLALIGAIALFVADRAQAQTTQPSSGNYGLHLGYVKAADAEDGNFLIGGHLEFKLAPIFGIQGAVDYRSEESFKGPGGDSYNIRSVPVTVTGRLYLPTSLQLTPFLLAGAGWYNVIYDYPQAIENLGVEDETVTTFGWHLGAGADIAISERVSIFGEGRYAFVDPERDFGEDVQDEIGTLDYDTLYLGTGLNLRFF